MLVMLTLSVMWYGSDRTKYVKSVIWCLLKPEGVTTLHASHANLISYVRAGSRFNQLAHCFVVANLCCQDQCSPAVLHEGRKNGGAQYYIKFCPVVCGVH